MGYVVLHLDKSPGNESAMTDHIERKVIHPNVDPERVYLNRELVEFPEGVHDRTEAIRHRLENAGLTRQVGKNQVQVIRFMLSGTSEDMKRIENDGKLDDWCRDNMDWLKETFGAENVVAATLHMDETTPHIHASVVPVVRGERRQKQPGKKKPEQETARGKPKRQYRKKDPNRPRLCADDVMAREKLIEYQDTYARAMAKYGLQRGIKGSDTRHFTLTEFYRNQAIESENLQTNIELLLAVENSKRTTIEELKQKEQDAKLKSEQAEKQQQQKESELKRTEESLSQVKGQLKTEKFKGAAADAGSSLMDGISSALGTPKVRRQQQEIEKLNTEKANLTKEVKELEQKTLIMQKEHETAIDKLKQELRKVHDLFPNLRELLRIEKLLQAMRFSENLIREILKLKPVGFKGKIYSPEHKQYFETLRSVGQIKPDEKDGNKLHFTIDGINPTDWFRKKYRELQEAIGVNSRHKSEMNNRRGIKL